MNGQQNGEAGKMIGRALQSSADLGFEIACACKEDGRDFAESGANFRADHAKAPKQCRFRFQSGIDCKQNSRKPVVNGQDFRADLENNASTGSSPVTGRSLCLVQSGRIKPGPHAYNRSMHECTGTVCTLA